MRVFIRYIAALLLAALQPVYAHPGHGIEFSLATLVILLGFLLLLVKLYNKKS